MRRRSTLLGLSGLVVGGGAVLGTGAFSTVEAERTVTIETAGDADAFLRLTDARGDSEYIEEDNGIIQINLHNLNRNATTTFRELVEITNQGTQTIQTINLEMFTPNGDNTQAAENVGDQTFWFPIDEVGGDGQALIGNNDDLLGQGVISSLAPGTSIRFGLEVRLTINELYGDGSGDLPDGSYSLRITAETE